MKNKYILKQFIAFLKKNNVYDEYLYELSKGKLFRVQYDEKWINPVDFIIYEIKREPSGLIINAFCWAKSTTLSQETWNELSNEWEDLILGKFEL